MSTSLYMSTVYRSVLLSISNKLLVISNNSCYSVFVYHNLYRIISSTCTCTPSLIIKVIAIHSAEGTRELS